VTTALCDLETSSVPDTDRAVASVRSLTNRLAQGIETTPTTNVIPFPQGRNAPKGTNEDIDGLVVAAVDGDRDAVERVLRWIRPLVVRYCRARVGGQEKTFASADDVAQEVCLAVLTALPGYRDQGRPFLAFVYGIASHKVADAHRAAARNRAEPVGEITDDVALTDGPEAQLMQSESAELMSKLLDMLPPKQRKILIMRVVTGLSAEKTAEAVGSTPGAVRVAQHRALNRLRILLTSGDRRPRSRRPRADLAW
jgi:RNA polymerase sigma-70 factor, ECF subfamily